MDQESVIHVSDKSFDEEILKSDKPSLVDFWAPWCGPCRASGPIIEELAGEYKDKVKVAKCNIDENDATASRFGVMSIPTFILFKDGKVVDKVVGLIPKEHLKVLIGKAL
jgi:thioredoxin 1